MSERELRRLVLVGAVGADVRLATFRGDEHVVAPVVMLVGGAVIRPVNAEEAELVPAEVLAQAPDGWNGRPVIGGDHPMLDGQAVSANTPAILERESIGSVFGVTFAANRLTGEAWVNTLQAAQTEDGPEIVQRLKAGEPVEISVGALVVAERRAGQTPDGREYGRVWVSVVPDHLALLRSGLVGACSVDMGCGAPRVASRHLVAASGGLRTLTEAELTAAGSVPSQPASMNRKAARGREWSAPSLSDFTDKTWGDLTAAERGRIASHYAWSRTSPPEAFGDLALPHHDPSSGAVVFRGVSAALGRLNQTRMPAADRAAVRAHLERHQRAFQQTAATGEVSVSEKVYDLFSMSAAASPDEMSDEERREMLGEVLSRPEPNLVRIMSVTGTSSGEVVYLVDPNPQGPDPLRPYRRTYEIDAEGQASVSDEREAVRPRTEWVPIMAKAKPSAQAIDQNTENDDTQQQQTSASDGSGCGCGAEGQAAEEGTMTIDERVAAMVADERTPYQEADAAWLREVPEDRLEMLAQAATGDDGESNADDNTTADEQAHAALVGQVIEAVSNEFGEEDRAMLLAAPAERLRSWLPQESQQAAVSNGDGTVQIGADELASLRQMAGEYKAAQADRKAALIASLQGAQEGFSDADLQGMHVAQLEKLAKALRVGETSQAVDYSMQTAGYRAASQAGGDSIEAFEPPKPYDLAIARRQQAS